MKINVKIQLTNKNNLPTIIKIQLNLNPIIINKEMFKFKLL